MKNDINNIITNDIFIIDDNDLTSTLIIEQIEKNGYIIRLGFDDEITLKMVNVNPPKIIFINIKYLIKQDFFYKKMKEIALYNQIKIIFIIPLDFLVNKKEIFEICDGDYITTPMHEKEILSRIEQHFTFLSTKEELQLTNEELKIYERELGKSYKEIITSVIRLEYQTMMLNKNNKILEEQKTLMEELTMQIEKNRVELENINKNKDRFFSIIAHDLRNPFNSLLKVFEMLTSKTYNFTSEEKTDLICELYNKSKIVYNLLENLLTWSKTQMNGIIFNPEIFTISKLKNDIISILLPISKNKNIKINFNIDEDLEIKADYEMIKTIFRNLISNAIKYSYSNDEILIKYRKIDNNMLEISVKDNGIGIVDDKQKKIFKIGYNIATDGTDGEQSTGLGLIICKNFIEKNNGEIWFNSTKDEGSTFFFTIPLK